MAQTFRLLDVHILPGFEVPFSCEWATIKDGELRIVMHRSQLLELAEVLEAEIADLPEEDQAA
ncbi:MAG: hypothetical protein IH994_05990 [Proteobacteria bacterium]|nr:hypothetical protein [Pseudomonadota bacterium]